MKLPSARLSCRRRNLPAFTLTELLVTVLIIIVLAALGFSAMSRMRRSGDQVVATRNLSQLHLANAAYAADNNGQYVPIQTFDDTGAKYVAWMNNPNFLVHLKGDSTYLSSGKVDTSLPTGLLDPVVVRAKKLNSTSVVASFGYCTAGVPGSGWGVPNSSQFFKVHQLVSPERTAAFITGTDWNISYANRFLWWQGNNGVEGFTPNQKMAYRHNGRALVVYYDGHVGAMSRGDIKAIDLQGGSKNIFWNGSAKP